MPGAAQHLSQVNSNKNFLYTFVSRPDGTTSFPDWAITVTFYIALHLVEQYLYVHHQKHCKNHRDRENEVESDPNLRKIYSHYKRLSDWSREARYDVVGFTNNEVREALSRLDAIEAHISPLILGE